MEKEKHVKATWDPVAHRVFLDVCIEEVGANNRPVQVLNALGYANLVKKFNERTKRNYDCKQIKNRWETLKNDYTVWKGLMQHASGLERYLISGTIDASELIMGTNGVIDGTHIHVIVREEDKVKYTNRK